MDGCSTLAFVFPMTDGTSVVPGYAEMSTSVSDCRRIVSLLARQSDRILFSPERGLVVMLFSYFGMYDTLWNSLPKSPSAAVIHSRYRKHRIVVHASTV